MQYLYFNLFQKREIIFIAVVEKHEKNQEDGGASDINISDIENRKIDQAEVDEITHI